MFEINIVIKERLFFIYSCHKLIYSKCEQDSFVKKLLQLKCAFIWQIHFMNQYTRCFISSRILDISEVNGYLNSTTVIIILFKFGSELRLRTKFAQTCNKILVDIIKAYILLYYQRTVTEMQFIMIYMLKLLKFGRKSYINKC